VGAAAYPFFPARRVANFAMLMMARSCVPSPIFSFSSRASTRNSTRRPSTRMTSAVKVTDIPIGDAPKCATFACVPTVSWPGSNSGRTALRQVISIKRIMFGL
jgi:hypothetical protein